MTTPTADDLVAAAARAAAPFASSPPRRRAQALVALADGLDRSADEIVELGRAETALPEARLRGELNRTTAQLRLFAEVAVEGAYLDARIDAADPDYVVGPRPDVRRVGVPVGPVLNFAASNFPLAFSVAGGDTAAALAAGCPVIVKVHEGHPRLSALVGGIAREALASVGLPADALSLVHSVEEATRVLRDGRIRAATFTGSTRVGRMLAEVAASRAVPIPFYGELGSLNPVFVTPAALRADPGALARGYAASVAGSGGQLCTKPGFCFVSDPAALSRPLAEALAAITPQRLLTPGISQAYAARREEILALAGVEVVVAGEVDLDASTGFAVATPTVVSCTPEHLVAHADVLVEEAFGPLSVLVGYDDAAQLPHLARDCFHGSLTATLHTAAEDGYGSLQELMAALQEIAGRVILNGWPTGVSVTAAMHHGGPYPAATVEATSVGASAIGRFLRPVAFQDAPAELLPPPLRDDNPWQVPQRRSPAGLSARWGTLDGRY